MNEDTSNEEVVEETVQETPEATKSEPSNLQEEPQIETPQYYGGKYSDQEEYDKAHKALLQKLNEQGKELNELRKPQLSPDKQEILNELKDLGVMTKEEFQREQAIETQKAKDEREIGELQLTDTQANALRRYASHKDNWNKSMVECWDELTGSIGGKVISRKTTLKPKKGNGEGFKEKSPQELARLSKEDYDKYWADYAANKANQ